VRAENLGNDRLAPFGGAARVDLGDFLGEPVFNTVKRHADSLRACEEIVASTAAREAHGAQEPQCIWKYMRIPSTAQQCGRAAQ